MQLYKYDIIGVLLVSVFMESISAKTMLEGQVVVETPPYWLISEYRTDADYFHGFGQVEKSGRRQDYVKECNNIAVEQISNSIRADVKIQSKRYIKEQESLGESWQSSLDKSFNLISDIRSETVLHRVEHVGEWEDNELYYVYKRLAVADYEYPMKVAVQSALKEYVNGMELKQSDPVKSLMLFLNAYRTIVPFLGETLRAEDPFSDFKSIKLDAELRFNIRESLMRIVVVPNQDSITANVFNTWRDQIKIETGFEIDGGFIPARFPIRFFSNNAETQISIKPDLSYWVGDDKISKIITTEFQPSLPSVIVNVSQEPVNIYLDLSELSLGKETNHHRVKPIIIKVLQNEMNAVILNDTTDAEYTLSVKIDTEISGHIHTMATAMAKMNYYFSNQNGIIFSGSMPDVKGSQMSDERASDAALKKMADSVKTTFTQQLEPEFLKNNNEYEKILPY